MAQFLNSMHIARSIPELRQHLAHSQCPAFVPTMGNLHAGHIKLVELAKPQGDCTVVSIFVNRLQFLPHEDFDSYPRTWDADCAKLEAAGCDVILPHAKPTSTPKPKPSRSTPIRRWPTSSKGNSAPAFSRACPPW